MAHLHPTLVSMFFGITILNALVMLYVWRIHFAERAIAYWTAGFVCAAFITGFQVFRLPVPDGLTTLLFNLFSIAATLGLTLGMATYVGRPEPWRAASSILVIAIAGIFYASVVDDNLTLRLLFYGAAVLLAHGRSVHYLLAPSTRPEGRARFAVVGVILLAVLAAGLRVLFSLSELIARLSLDQFRIGEFWLVDLITVQILLPISLLLMMSERLMRRLERLAHHDSLTGILNRRAFLERAEAECARAARHARPASILVLDIDHFKRINDTAGHHAGDEILRAVVAAIAATLRKEDLFCRFGGEEFCLLLPETDIENARDLAERIRHRVSELQVTFEGRDLNVTISIGIAVIGIDRLTVQAALDVADRALYRAKSNGRNCIELGQGICASPVPASP